MIISAVLCKLIEAAQGSIFSRVTILLVVLLDDDDIIIWSDDDDQYYDDTTVPYILLP